MFHLASDRRLLFVLFHDARFSCNIISLLLWLTVCFYPSNQDQSNVLTRKCYQSASAKHILSQAKVLQEAFRSQKKIKKVAYIYSTRTSGKSYLGLPCSKRQRGCGVNIKLFFSFTQKKPSECMQLLDPDFQ